MGVKNHEYREVASLRNSTITARIKLCNVSHQTALNGTSMRMQNRANRHALHISPSLPVMKSYRCGTSPDRVVKR